MNLQNIPPAAKINQFTSFDGLALTYRRWEPLQESKKAIIIMHRGHEHSGRVELLVNELAVTDCWSFAYDARGHGLTPGERGYAKDFSYLVKDLNEFAKYINLTYKIPLQNIAVVANSVGAVVTATWVHDYAPPIRGMVLAAPAFRIKLYVPLALPSLRLVSKFKEKVFIKSYVKSTMLTHDLEQSKAYDEDPLIARSIAVNILIGLHDTSTRIIADAGAINTPTLILSAGSDWVVKNSAQKKFFERLSAKVKSFSTYPNFYHGILYEKERHKVIAETKAFLSQCFSTTPSQEFLLEADKNGYTKNEFERLKQPAGFFNNLNYKMQIMSMKTLGKSSDGIRLGLETGFDSGKSLDYVYQNKASGCTPIGKMIDRIYLNAIGWKGIRIRKTHLEQLMLEAIAKIPKKEIKIIDVAAGIGRYIFEVLPQIQNKEIHIHLRDYQDQNLEKAKALAEKLNIKNVTFENASVFDENSYKSNDFDIAITSGIFELFPDNGLVIKALKGIHKVLSPNGYLIYTGQPWHPQLEMIAKTLTNREGQPWIMRRRTQAELDQLIHFANFSKLNSHIDPYGIFTVSLSQKNEELK